MCARIQSRVHVSLDFSGILKRLLGISHLLLTQGHSALMPDTGWRVWTHTQRLSPAQPAPRTDSNSPTVPILSVDVQAQASTSLSIRQLDWISEFCISLSQTAAPSETRDNPLDYWHCEGILVRFHNKPQQQFNHRLPLTHAVQTEHFQQNLMWSYTHAHNSPGLQQQHRCSSFFPYLSLTLSWVAPSQLCRCMLHTSGSRRHGWWRGKGARGSGRREKSRRGGRAGERVRGKDTPWQSKQMHK